MIQTNIPRNCVVILLLCELTVGHFGRAVLVHEYIRKPCNFEACVDHYILILFILLITIMN